MEIARLNDNTLIFVEFGLDVSGVVCFTDGITEWLGEEAETGFLSHSDRFSHNVGTLGFTKGTIHFVS